MRTWIVVALLAVATVSSASVIVVDDYSQNLRVISLSTDGFDSVNDSIPHPTPFAATRLMQLQIRTSDPSNFARASSRVANGVWSVNSDNEVRAQATMFYTTPGFDYNFGLSRVFKVTFDYIESNTSFRLFLLDTSGQFAEEFADYTGPTGATNLYFDFSSYTNLDFGAIQTLNLGNRDTRGGIDFRISALEAVPEPTSIAALGLGLLAVARRRKK